MVNIMIFAIYLQSAIDFSLHRNPNSTKTKQNKKNTFTFDKLKSLGQLSVSLISYDCLILIKE